MSRNGAFNRWVSAVAFSGVAVCAVAIGLTLRAQQETIPALPPAETPAGPKGEAKIDPAAQGVLKQIEQAYARLQSLELEGDVSINLEIGEDKQRVRDSFSSSYQAPNKFRHEINGELVLGSTGEQVYVFNERANAFLATNAPPEKTQMNQWPNFVPEILQSQNPSLLFALAKDPIKDVIANVDEVNKLAEQEVDGKKYQALEVRTDHAQGQITLLVDPETHLLRRFKIDMKPALEKSGATNVQTAFIQVDYTDVQQEAKFDAAHFAWTPPAGAQDIREAAGAPRPQQEGAQELVGRVAPDFTLSSPEGKELSLSDLKGKVVVLDFWATWCPPCVKSLPELAKLAKEQGGEDVKVFAINIEEDKEKVQSFLETRKIDVPVLLDRKGEVSKKYNVRSIPQTVVIGKDGKIQKVFVGFGEDTFEKLQQEVLAAKQKEGTASPQPAQKPSN